MLAYTDARLLFKVECCTRLTHTFHDSAASTVEIWCRTFTTSARLEPKFVCKLPAPSVLVRTAAFCTEQAPEASLNKVRASHSKLCTQAYESTRAFTVHHARQNHRCSAVALPLIALVVIMCMICIDMQHLLQAAPAYGLLTQYVCRVHHRTAQWS